MSSDERRDRYADAIGDHTARECTRCAPDHDIADAVMAVADQEHAELEAQNARLRSDLDAATRFEIPAHGGHVAALQGHDGRWYVNADRGAGTCLMGGALPDLDTALARARQIARGEDQ